MVSHRLYSNDPWPKQTPAPIPSSSASIPWFRSAKRRRVQDLTAIISQHIVVSSRQVVADQSQIAQAKINCEFNSGNEVISCFPTADVVISQHEWATFVWNSRRPEITQTNLVDIFLFRGDSGKQILHFPDVNNPTDQAGSITAHVNDTWWGSDGANWHGKNVSFPFFWVLQRSGTPLDGNEIAQPTFSAVQTTFADFVVAASRSSALAAAESSARASASQASVDATRTTSTTSASLPSSKSTPGASGSVQHPSNGSGFPHWAIAVIVVLGFLAIVMLGLLAFLIVRRIQRRRQEVLDSNRNSMGSASPILVNAHAGQSSPLLTSSAYVPPQGDSLHAGSVVGASGVGIGAAALGTSGHGAPSILNDGASTISRSGSAGDSGPFSGADAAIMADAFRKMLRKPDFAGQPVEDPVQEEMISRELANEGRDIRNVDSSRGVRVERMQGEGGPTQDT